jgi:hypothetical protein
MRIAVNQTLLIHKGPRWRFYLVGIFLSVQLTSAPAGLILLEPSQISPTSARMETDSVSVTPVGGALRLSSAPSDRCPALTLRAPDGKWNLDADRFVEFTLTNSGKIDVEFTLWALSPGGWSGVSTYPFDTRPRMALKPGEGDSFKVDLWARFPGPDAYTGVVDPANIDRVRIVFQSSRVKTNDFALNGGQLDLYSIRAVGDAPSARVDLKRRVIVPEITDGPPDAGRRKWRKLDGYSGTALRHVLTLPQDWKPGTRYPIIVEYTGNEFYHQFCHSTGLTEQGTMAWGLARGERFICLNLPFVSKDGQHEEHNGWGDEAKTIDYCIAAINDTCEKFGGDSSAVLLTGFSRGRHALNYIALRDDRIADVWLAFVGTNPGRKWPGGKGWRNCGIGWDERGARLKGRAWFDDHPNYGRGVHVDTEYLEDNPSTLKTRAWMTEVLNTRQGTHDVRGRVTDAHGQGMSGVRIQSGATHFTFTDDHGGYVLRSLIDGPRVVTAAMHPPQSEPDERKIVIAGKDVNSVDFSLK